MAVAAKIPGMDELLKQLQYLPPRMQMNVLRTTIFRGAQSIRDLAMEKLQSNGSVRTGKLLRDIVAKRSRSTEKEVVAKVEVGQRGGKRSAWYGFLVERGHAVKRTVGFEARGKNTRSFNKGVQGPATQIRKKKETVGHVAARPFLIPAFEENKDKIKKDIQKGMQEEIIKAVKKINATSGFFR